MFLLTLSIHEPNLFILRENPHQYCKVFYSYYLFKYCKSRNAHKKKCSFCFNYQKHFNLIPEDPKETEQKVKVQITDNESFIFYSLNFF